MVTSDLITIGQVVAPQGLKGEVRVYPLTDFPERFASLKAVYLVLPSNLEQAQSFTVTTARSQGRLIVLKFAGIDSREAAEGLRGAKLKVPRTEVYPLPQGHYYVFELVGLSVYTESGHFVGTIKDVITTGANDVYVVERPEQAEVLIPAVKQVVRTIDLAKGQMVICPLPGLLDD